MSPRSTRFCFTLEGWILFSRSRTMASTFRAMPVFYLDTPDLTGSETGCVDALLIATGYWTNIHNHPVEADYGKVHGLCVQHKSRVFDM